MKKNILFLLLVSLSFPGIAQSKLTINAIAVTGVDPVTRGETFDVEIKYISDNPVNARIQFWMTFFNGKEYDAFFINEQANCIVVNEGEENKEKKVVLKIKFPSVSVISGYAADGFGDHKEFKIMPTSKLLKGESYLFRIYASKKDQMIDATTDATNINIKGTSIQNQKTVLAIAPIINDIKELSQK